MDRLLLTLFCLILASSCYRMPTDEDFSVIPSTNHPDYTRESKGGSPMPGAGF